MKERFPGKFVIGLTGNIAVGKSLVMGMLAELGAATIDADRVAHDVILRGSPVFDQIVATFGDSIIGADGQIIRAALGAIVFSDSDKLRQLEAITHPAIGRRIDELARDAAQPALVIEAIKLLEGQLRAAVDAVWGVDASPATQRRRLMSERGLTEADAQRRIDAQNKQADKLRQADVIIRNDGDIEATRRQVEQAWAALKTG